MRQANIPIILKDGDAVNYDLKFVHGLLTVEAPPSPLLNSQPVNPFVPGSTATFTADATTTIAVPVTYQWQYSSDSSSWNNIAGAN